MRSILSASLFATTLLAQSPQRDASPIVAALERALDAPTELSLATIDRPAGSPERFELRIDLADGPLMLDAWRHTLRSDDFSVSATDAHGRLVEVDAPPSATYRALVRGRPGAIASLSLTDSGVAAAIVERERALFVQPVREFIAGADARAHVVYVPRAMPLSACGTSAVGGATPEATSGLPGGFFVAEIAFDVDVDFYQFRGASISACVQSVEQAVDAINLIYERDVDVTHRITRVIVRTSEPDPYDGNDANVILGTQFRGEWNTNQQSVRRDIAHFVTSRPMGNIAGLAYVGVVCSSTWGYGLSRFGNSLGSNANVLGHEVGHNWDLPHCLDACDIMCGCGTGGGIGPNDRARLIAFRDTRTCLAPLFPDLVAHYRLDETSGNTANDAARFDHDATFAGGPTLGVAGATTNTGTAVRFDGRDDVAAIPTGTGLDQLHRAASVAAWVRPRTASAYQRFFGSQGSWSFGLSGDRLVFSASGFTVTHDSRVSIPLGTWSHVAAVWGEDLAVTFYVDGSNVGTIAGTVPASPAVEWYVGRLNQFIGNFDGDLDDVQVYYGRLDDRHMARLFARPGETICTPGSVGYGSGLRGTLGVPSLSITGFPIPGHSFTARIGNSLGVSTTGLAVLGIARASIPVLGGTLLVDPTVLLTVPLTVPVSGAEIRFAIPGDPNLRCRKLDLQAIVWDRGAPFGWAFTAGLEVTIGS